MTDHDSLFSAISSQEKILEKQTLQLSNIERSLIAIELQAKDINHLEKSLSKLWSLHDNLFGPDGIVTDLKSYKASCPAEALKNSIAQLWVAVGLVVTLILGLRFWR